MQPYGIDNKKHYNYIDNHPKKGYINWWEAEKNISKNRARQLAKKEIQMSVTIVDSEGSPIIKLDETDSKKDTIVKDGKEISLLDAVKEVNKTVEEQ